MIWAYSENLVKIGLVVEAVETGTGMGRHTSDYIDNLSLSLWLLAWLGSALAEVCQLYFSQNLGRATAGVPNVFFLKQYIWDTRQIIQK